MLECNQAMAEIFHFKSPAELVGKNGFTLVSPSDHQKRVDTVNRIAKNGLVRNVELNMQTCDGKEFMASFSGRRLDNSSGSSRGFVAVVKNITVRKEMENSLKQKLRFEKAISAISLRFVSLSNLNEAINASLADICKLCGASRGYIFFVDRIKQTMSMKYEWCNSGVRPNKGKLQSMSTANLSWFLNILQDRKSVCVGNVSKMPAAARAEQVILVKQGVKSLVALPLYITNEFGGFVGFDNIKSIEIWSLENIDLLRIYSEIIGSAVGNKRSMEALRTSEKRFVDISSNINEWVWEVDGEGRYIYSNDSVERILGYKPSEVLGRHFYDFFLPQEREQLRKAAFETFGLRASFSGFINRNLHKNGSTVYLETSGVPVFDVNGQFTGYRGSDYDITERVKTEEALKANEEKYRQLINGMNDTAWVIDLDAKFVDVNDAAVKLLGYSREELLSMGPSDIDNSLSREQIKDMVRRMPADRVQVFETSHTTKDGKTIPVEISSSLITYQGKQAVLSIARDITDRKKAQEALKESEEKFRNLSEELPNMIFINSKGKVVYANKKCEDIMGYTKEEFYSPAFNFFSLIAPESKEKLRSSYGKHSTGKEVDPYEYRLVTKTGKKIDAVITSKLITYDGERAILGIVTDISKLKETENALREARERYISLFDNAPLGVLVVDPDTLRAVEFNDLAHQQLGYSREEFSKLSIPDFETEETPEETRKHVDTMLREGGAEFETKHRTKNGGILNVLVTTKTISLGGKTYLHSIFHDITDIRKVQDALMASEAQYRQLIELAQEGVCAIDNNYYIVFVNPRMSQMLGFTESEMVGKHVLTFIDKAVQNKVGEFLENHKQGIRGSFEHELTRKDGSHVYTRVTASQIIDDEGNPLGTLALLSDITQHKQMESQLEEYSKHLEELVKERTKQLEETQAQLIKSERLAAIGELASMVGHDLRNPLTGIKNAAYYLKKKGTCISETQNQEMLDIIDKCVDHSNNIINDLLDFSREIHLELQYQTPLKLITEALSLVHVPENVKILNHLTDETQIQVDTEKMERVFINLIKNAIDAMPNGGKIIIGSKATAHKLEFSVTDTGTGIPKDVLPKLFTPLFTTKAKGMGFGLAICKRIVETHQGKITVETAPNKGTTFKVTLPLQQKQGIEEVKEWINPQAFLSNTAHVYGTS